MSQQGTELQFWEFGRNLDISQPRRDIVAWSTRFDEEFSDPKKRDDEASSVERSKLAMPEDTSSLPPISVALIGSGTDFIFVQFQKRDEAEAGHATRKFRQIRFTYFELDQLRYLFAEGYYPYGDLLQFNTDIDNNFALPLPDAGRLGRIRGPRIFPPRPNEPLCLLAQANLSKDYETVIKALAYWLINTPKTTKVQVDLSSWPIWDKVLIAQAVQRLVYLRIGILTFALDEITRYQFRLGFYGGMSYEQLIASYNFQDEFIEEVYRFVVEGAMSRSQGSNLQQWVLRNQLIFEPRVSLVPGTSISPNAGPTRELLERAKLFVPELFASPVDHIRALCRFADTVPDVALQEPISSDQKRWQKIVEVLQTLTTEQINSILQEPSEIVACLLEALVNRSSFSNFLEFFLKLTSFEPYVNYFLQAVSRASSQIEAFSLGRDFSIERFRQALADTNGVYARPATSLSKPVAIPLIEFCLKVSADYPAFGIWYLLHELSFPWNEFTDEELFEYYCRIMTGFQAASASHNTNNLNDSLAVALARPQELQTSFGVLESLISENQQQTDSAVQTVYKWEGESAREEYHRDLYNRGYKLCKWTIRYWLSANLPIPLKELNWLASHSHDDELFDLLNHVAAVHVAQPNLRLISLPNMQLWLESARAKNCQAELINTYEIAYAHDLEPNYHTGLWTEIVYFVLPHLPETLGLYPREVKRVHYARWMQYCREEKEPQLAFLAGRSSQGLTLKGVCSLPGYQGNELFLLAAWDAVTRQNRFLSVEDSLSLYQLSSWTNEKNLREQDEPKSILDEAIDKGLITHETISELIEMLADPKRKAFAFLHRIAEGYQNSIASQLRKLPSEQAEQWLMSETIAGHRYDYIENGIDLLYESLSLIENPSGKLIWDMLWECLQPVSEEEQLVRYRGWISKVDHEVLHNCDPVIASRLSYLRGWIDSSGSKSVWEATEPLVSSHQDKRLSLFRIAMLSEIRGRKTKPSDSTDLLTAADIEIVYQECQRSPLQWKPLLLEAIDLGCVPTESIQHWISLLPNSHEFLLKTAQSVQMRSILKDLSSQSMLDWLKRETTRQMRNHYHSKIDELREIAATITSPDPILVWWLAMEDSNVSLDERKASYPRWMQLVNENYQSWDELDCSECTKLGYFAGIDRDTYGSLWEISGRENSPHGYRERCEIFVIALEYLLLSVKAPLKPIDYHALIRLVDDEQHRQADELLSQLSVDTVCDWAAPIENTDLSFIIRKHNKFKLENNVHFPLCSNMLDQITNNWESANYVQDALHTLAADDFLVLLKQAVHTQGTLNPLLKSRSDWSPGLLWWIMKHEAMSDIDDFAAWFSKLSVAVMPSDPTVEDTMMMAIAQLVGIESKSVPILTDEALWKATGATQEDYYFFTFGVEQAIKNKQILAPTDVRKLYELTIIEEERQLPS